MAEGVSTYAQRMAMMGAALTALLGGVACEEEVKPPPVVVAPVNSQESGDIRICPKCYRRFFGGQEHCTVDGTALIDYEASLAHNGGVGDPQAGDSGKKAEPAAVTPQELRSDAAAAGDVGAGRVAALVPKAPKQEPAADNRAPVQVRPRATPIPKYEPPPVEPWSPPGASDKPAGGSTAPKATPQRAVEQEPAVVAKPAPEATQAPPAVAVVPAAPPRSAEEILEDLFGNQEATNQLAQAGKLSPDEIGALVSVSINSEERFTASRSFLAMHYKSTGNSAEYGKALEALMQVPSNQYNPTIRLEQAEHYLLTKQYQNAVEAATIAERYRQKFPRGDIYYIRLARTYEVLAKSYEGRFTGTEDPDDLDLAIRMWQRYLTHVEKKDDDQRIKMAQENIVKLERIKERVL